jgi:hypothetical protein
MAEDLKEAIYVAYSNYAKQNLSTNFGVEADDKTE